MMQFLYGPNRFLVLEAGRSLEEAFRAAQPEGGVTRFHLEEDTPQDFLAAAAPDLFSQARLLVVISPFSLPLPAREPLIAFLEAQETDADILFLEPAEPKKNERLFKALAAKTQARQITLPTQADLEKRIDARLKQGDQGASMSLSAKRHLVERVGSNPARFFSELEKLALFGAGRTLEVADIDLLVAPEETDRIFLGLDALAAGRRPEASALLRESARLKKSALPVFGLLAWQLRQLLSIRELYDGKVQDPARIASKLRIAPFVAVKNLKIISAFPLERTRQGLKLLSRYDRDLKRGALDEYAALDLFVWKL